MKVRLAAVAAVLVALGATLLPAAPAAALQSIAAVGSIDSVAVTYVDPDNPKPYLHLTGWAADLNDWGANGHTAAGIEFTAAAPGGPRVSIGWAEYGDFALPRPDVQRYYPAGPYQGFEARYLGPLPGTGVVNVCARLYNINAAPVYTAVFTCFNVSVPAARPSVATLTGPSVTGAPVALSANVGAQLDVSLSAPTGGTDSYAWDTWNGYAPSASGYPTILPGVTGSTYTTGVADSGRQLRALVTSRLPSVTIEQWTYPVSVFFPLPDGSTRVSSSDRFATAVAVSQSAFPDSAAGVPVAYIASGVTFPDALSAGAAAAKQHGTLLLTHPGQLDAVAAAELVRLHPQRVIVVGGEAAIGEAVVDQVRALPFAPEVRRIGGPDRFAVSRAVVEDAWGGKVPDLYLVTGNAFPDALAAAAAGAQTGRPVLLVNGWLGKPDAPTADALTRWETTHVTVVGGPNSVTDGIATGLGVPVDRLAGQDRFTTAAQVASSLPHTGFAYLASGMNFPDALTTAVIAGVNHAPLLLSTGWCAPVSELSALRDTGVTRLVVIGGEAVVSGNALGVAC